MFTFRYFYPRYFTRFYWPSGITGFRTGGKRFILQRRRRR